VLLDHVIKDREGRGRYALGGVHKLNAVSGAGYLLVNRAPFGIAVTGRSSILISKDRPGQLRAHGLHSTGGLFSYGDLVMTSHDRDRAEIRIWPPREKEHNDQPSQPTIYMIRIAEALRKHGELKSKNHIETAVEGKATTIREALNCLISDGYVNGCSPYKLLKPYPPEDEK
jgi:hypothetical protein